MEHRKVTGADAPTARPFGQDPGASTRPVGDPRRGGADDGLVLDRYRLLDQLGAGAFGVVWRARDERLGREVAVKAIALDRGAERAEREAIAAARLQHPAIVTLYEAGSEGDATYLVSELVRGGTLADLLAEGALSDRDVAEIGIALCQALAHAHAQGVVHRDVKPSNVLVPDVPHAGGPVAKLTDFGVARVLSGAGAVELLTATGDVVGTLAYMAPEQAEGREATARADLYAAALVLYEALSGVNPIRGGTAVATARRLGATLPPLGRQRRDLPPALCAAIDRALAPRPKDRGSVAHLSRALRAARPELDDEPGAIAAPALERAATAVTQVVERGRRGWRRRSREQELAAVAAELGATGEWAVEDRRGDGREGRRARDAGWDGGDRGREWADDDTRADARGGPFGRRRTARPAAGERIEGWDGPRRVPAPLFAGHVLPGLLAGGLVALALALLPVAASATTVPSPLLAGALAGVVVGLLPRIGWLAAAAVLIAWVAGPASLPGAALLIAAAAAPIPLLLPLAGRTWSLPFAAPLLGVALLAGAYPALAGQARTLWRRAALGALGFWMLALAEPLAHATLWFGSARGTRPPGAWEGSLTGAAEHALAPLLQSGALATAALWAAAAAVLPWIVRGRHAALDLVAATVWAAGLAAGAGAIGAAFAHELPRQDPRGVALGAAAAVLIAVAARAARLARDRRRAPEWQEPIAAPAAWRTGAAPAGRSGRGDRVLP